MACKNEQCRWKTFCEVKSQRENDPLMCDEYKTISAWWRDKITGIRDPDEDFTEEDFEDG